MLKAKLFTILVFVKSLFCTCDCIEKSEAFELSNGGKVYKIRKIDKLPDSIKESSAVVLDRSDENYHLWTLSDSGGDAVLYKVNKHGELALTLPVPNSQNIDWEALATDHQGNFYIGDFGNNRNNRRNLKIYKFNPETNKTSVINYKYPDQKEFPPEKDNQNFDAESLFWFSDSLYIFSKNRGNDIVKLYKLPDERGDFTAEITDKISLPGMITDAGISPDSKTFALLSYGRIYLFGLTGGKVTFDNPLTCIPFAKSGQAEGITFLNNTNLLVTNENRKVFLVERKKPK